MTTSNNNGNGQPATLGQNAVLVLIGTVAIVGIISAALSTQGVIIFGFSSMVCVYLFQILQTNQVAAAAAQDRQEAARKVAEVARAQAETSRHVEDVKDALKQSTVAAAVKADEGLKIAKDTHTLVNSNMGVQLRLNAELSRWKANQTGLPEDARAADVAERMIREHEAKQRLVDDATPAAPVADAGQASESVTPADAALGAAVVQKVAESKTGEGGA